MMPAVLPPTGPIGAAPDACCTRPAPVHAHNIVICAVHDIEDTQLSGGCSSFGMMPAVLPDCSCPQCRLPHAASTCTHPRPGPCVLAMTGAQDAPCRTPPAPVHTHDMRHVASFGDGLNLGTAPALLPPRCPSAAGPPVHIHKGDELPGSGIVPAVLPLTGPPVGCPW